ncbi:hypothetical protein [Pikeienuella sp. HZG-20]|uniref:hypothetical protein n=1 Tax=Paludibacillus litoralis TaxID=3133267 RepID=UPI0030EB6A05
MTSMDLGLLIQQFEHDKLVPPSPLVKTTGLPEGSALMTMADLEIDLAKALDEAENGNFDELDIFADTVNFPAKFNRRLDRSVRRVTIVSRRMAANGPAILRMSHEGADTGSVIRIVAAEIDADINLFGGPRGKDAYDLSQAVETDGPPSFVYFGWRDGAMAVRSVRVPPGLLTHGAPLHLVLSTQFDLAAAILGAPLPGADELRLCHDTLGWINRWSGVDTEFGELTRSAEALRSLIPAPTDSGVMRPMPVLGADRYIDLAEAHSRAMSTMEDTLRSIDSEVDISTMVGSLVTAFADRDTIDLDTLLARRDDLEKRLADQIDALDAASRTIAKDQFDAELASLQLELQNNLATIKRSVKLAFDIAFAIVAIAGSAAALCVGVPPNPAALTDQGVKGVQGVGDMFTEAKQLGASITDVKSALTALLKYFVIPINWARHNSDVLSKFADPAKSVLHSALPVLNNPARGLERMSAEKMARTVAELGDAMRGLSDYPQAEETKAAWTILETEMVNMLGLVINDPDSESEIKTAANNYKTAVQKVCVHGRLLAEQMAAKISIARQLAALKLEWIAIVSKRQRLETLTRTIGDATEMRKQLRSEALLRAEGAARGFFVATYGARAAQIYETSRPLKSRVVKARATAAMATALADFKTEYQSALAVSARERGAFERELVIDDKALMESLSAGNPILFDLDSENADFAAFNRVRLSRVEAWAGLVQPTPQRIAVRIVSGRTFRDRGKSGIETIFSDPLSLRFEHQDNRINFVQTLTEALPTPFTRWVIELLEPSPLPGPVHDLRLVFKGWAAT